MMNETLTKWLETHKEFATPIVKNAGYIRRGAIQTFLLEDDEGTQVFVYDCGNFDHAHYCSRTTVFDEIKETMELIEGFKGYKGFSATFWRENDFEIAVSPLSHD